jgi:cytochrome c556
MNGKARRIALVFLSLGGVVLFTSLGGAGDSREAGKAVLALAEGKDVEAGKVDAKEVAALRARFEDLETFMTLFKPRHMGGLGYTPEGKRDGIEMKLFAIRDKQYTQAQVNREASELVRVARVNVVIAEVVRSYRPARMPAVQLAVWDRSAQTLKEASVELAKAARDKDAPRVKTAVSAITAACGRCHGLFRFGPILELVEDDNLEKGKIDARAVATVRSGYEELDRVMNIYTPVARGGLGYGSVRKGEGIEAKLLALGKAPLPAATLKAEADELVRVARLNVALAELTRLYPAPKKPGVGPRQWNQHADALKRASVDLAGAVRKNDPAGVKKASLAINQACETCHRDFR